MAVGCAPGKTGPSFVKNQNLPWPARCAMTFLQILILALVQGFCELLPVSSSAHVIVAEKLMGLEPTAPDMTLLLVALHTGTMFAVITYFWRGWRSTYFSSAQAFRRNAAQIVLATAATGAVALALLHLIPGLMGLDRVKFEIEQLFGDARLIAGALAAAGVLILTSGLKTRSQAGHPDFGARAAISIGAVQGLCLPFRGFSRSGATISAALFMGIARQKAEEFSFALAVVLTPAVIAKELQRFFVSGAHAGQNASALLRLAWPSAVGMVLSFFAGLLALRWLSSWLERGRWHYFGYYCLAAAVVVLTVLH